MDKISFYKFIWVHWKMKKKKKYMYMYLGCFSSSRCVKKKRKETKQEVGWATAQLGHDTMGNCIVTQ